MYIYLPIELQVVPGPVGESPAGGDEGKVQGGGAVLQSHAHLIQLLGHLFIHKLFSQMGCPSRNFIIFNTVLQNCW